MLKRLQQWRKRLKAKPLSDTQRMIVFAAMSERFQRRLLGLPIESLNDLIERVKEANP